MKKTPVLHQVQLREVIIEKVNCRRHSDFHLDAKLQVDFVVKAKTLNKNEAYAYLTVKIFSEKEPKVFSLEIMVRGKMENEKTTNRTTLKRFAEAQGLPLLLPWVRETVASLTRQMGLPQLLLPLINVFETLRAERVDEKVYNQKDKG